MELDSTRSLAVPPRPCWLHLHQGFTSSEAPAALTWEHWQFGGAGWMWQPAQGCLQELRPGSAAVLGVHTQHTPLGCGTCESGDNGQVPSTQQCCSPE